MTIHERSLIQDAKKWNKITISDPLSEKILLTYNFEDQSITGLKNLSPSILHASGICLFENFQEIQKQLLVPLEAPLVSTSSDYLFHAKQMLCVALDTNAILGNVYYHLISNMNLERYHPFLLLLSQAIAHEFHYMQSFKVSRDDVQALKEFKKDNPSIQHLFFKNFKWDLIYNAKGRRGLSGIAKFEQLSRERTIVTRSHGHLFYSAPIVSKSTTNPNIGMDSVYDTLIQTEIELFQASTNAKILFLSGDQFLVNVFSLLGIDAIQLTYPPKPMLPTKISHSQFHRILTELLVPHLLLELSIQQNSSEKVVFLTYANEIIGKKTRGRKAMAISSEGNTPWLWDLRFD